LDFINTFLHVCLSFFNFVDKLNRLQSGMKRFLFDFTKISSNGTKVPLY
jgi:hypothetical protein